MTRSAHTVLLIEDFAPDREQYRRFLFSDASAAYTVLEADSVELGLELCRTQPIAAIVLDYLLPDADGVQFLELLQAQSDGNTPPVVMVTGEGDEAIAVQAMKLGVEDYLVKGRLTPEILQLAVRKAIESTTLRQQLQAANQQITTIWESMTDAYVTLDLEWRVVYANSAATRVYKQLTGLEPQEFLGKSHWEIFPTLVGSAVEQAYRRAVAEQVTVHFEVFYEPTNDWFEAHAYPSTAGLGIYFQKISDRKRLEAEREQAKAERDRFFELSSDLLMIGTLHGSFLQVNPAWTTTLGWSLDELTTREYLEFVHPDDLAATRKAAEALAQGGTLMNFENRYRCRDGSYRWLSWNVVVEKDNLMYGVARDVSDRKQAENNLRQSEERYRYLSGLIPQLVWIASADGVMLDVNERWTEFTGLSLEQAQSKGWQPIVHPEDVPILQAAWQLAQQAETHYQAEGRIQRVDGTYRWHLHQAMPLKNKQGQIVKWFGTATDIHDLKQIEVDRARLLAETQAAREAAEAANRSKDEFVAIVAHELRSPLNSIAGWSQLLQTRKFDEATMTKALDAIYRNTQAQVQLVEDLLDVSRLVRGTLQINSTPLNLSHVIQASLEAVRPAVAAKQIQLETQLHDPAQILGDVNRLQQIVVNLLTNAIKFTPELGRVEVSLGPVLDHIELQVRDTGKGIAAEFLPYIFERFQQGQRNTGAKDGLGLGLAIVKNLVELHQGTVSAESPGIGQGSTFTVRFPVLKVLGTDRLPAAEGDLTLDQTPLAGVRIFVVDDEPDMLSLITFVLEDYGAEVKAALSAAETLAQLPEFKPDILISDVAMPNGNGYELVQQLRSRSREKLPAIALTAYSSTTHAERSLQAGFQCHLTKPVDPQDLVTAVLSLVRGGTV